jgi:hypothetical protein
MAQSFTFTNIGTVPRVVFNENQTPVIVPPGKSRVVAMNEGTVRQMLAFCAKDTSLRMAPVVEPVQVVGHANTATNGGHAREPMPTYAMPFPVQADGVTPIRDAPKDKDTPKPPPRPKKSRSRTRAAPSV